MPAPSDSSPSRPARTDDIKRGVAYVSASIFIFSMANVLVKYLAAEYPVSEIVFFRSFFALIPILAMMWRGGKINVFHTRRPIAHLVRASMWLSSFYCWFFAIKLLPLADAAAYSFTAPIFLTVLSMPLLGERVGPHRWAAVLVGFVGVVIMARPTGDVLQIGALYGIANALFYALGSLGVREMSRTEKSETIVFYTQLFGSALSGLGVLFVWVTPSWTDAAGMAVIGLAGGIGQYLMTQAYRYAPAAVVGPFTYTSIIWSVILGYVFWQDLPGLEVVIGVAIVAASGLYILHRETRSPPAAVSESAG
jgi:drug/metabolite transporter (DMT)-like permease